MKITIGTLPCYAIALILLLQVDALGQSSTTELTSPPAPQPLNRIARATVVDRVAALIRIEATIIELDRDRGLDFDVAIDDVKSVRQSNGAITIIAKQTQDNLVRALLDSKSGRVISRPQVMTTSGRSATVQIGKEVPIPSSGNEPAVNRHIGLQLECRPRLTGKRLSLEVECVHSQLNDQNGIEEQKLEAAVEIDSGETLMISGAGENQLIVMLTPQVLPADAKRSASPRTTRARPLAKATPRPPKSASRPQSAFGRHVAKIQDIFRSVDRNSLSGIEVDEDKILVLAFLAKDEQAKIPEVLSQLAEVPLLQVSHVTTKTLGDGVQIEIRCELGSDQEQPSDNSLSKMDRVMQELFPEEVFDITELPNSVVLRGKVSEKSIPRIISVAEQFFPSVINHFEPLSPDTNAGPATTDDDGIGKQLGELREEVRSLHEDVKKLIEIMETEADDQAANTSEPTSRTVLESATPSLDKYEAWNLSLPEVISIVMSNHRDQEPEELQKRVNASRQSFAQLQSLQLQNAALKSQSAPSEVAQFYSLRGAGSQTFEAFAPLGVRRKSEQRRNLQLKILKEEYQLRSQMGLPAQDGRLITPLIE